MKVMTFLRAPEGHSRQIFQNWALTTLLGRVRETFPHAAQIAVNQVLDTPSDRPHRAYEQTESQPAYDVVLEIWDNGADAQALSRKVLRDLAQDYSGPIDMYSVDERIVLDRYGPPTGPVTPGVKYIGRLLFHQDLPLSAIKRSWALHGELAVRTFINLNKYVQNIVVETLTPDSAPASGIPEVYFPTVEGFKQTLNGGQEQIAHDLRHLINSGVRLYTSEYVLR